MSNTEQLTTDDTTLAWGDLVAAVTAADGGVFLATTGPDGRPHVAYVVPGWADGRLWIATFASSRKGANLRTNPQVAITCAPTPQSNVLVRATARLVDDPAEVAELWASGALPYDLTMFFGDASNPDLLFVELVVDSASIHELGPAPIRRWRPTA